MNKNAIRFIPAAAASFCAVLIFLAGPNLRAATRHVIPGHVPKMALGLKPLKHMEGTNRLRLAISLPLQNKEALSNLFEQIYDPASTNFHHFITAQQFADRFGPAQADYQALESFMGSNHLAIVGTHPNRAILDVEGSVADIEKVFHVNMQVYHHPTKNRSFYAPDTDPSVDLAIPLLHVHGLDNAVVPFPKIKHKPVANLTNSFATGTGSGPAGNFQGYDFRSAYVPGVNLRGTGQSVALFELDGYFTSDVTTYEGQAGLPSVPLINILLDGDNGIPQTTDGDAECTLDIDMAIAMAPGISAVYVYEGYTPEDILNRIATDNISRQISCSWGWAPFDPTSDQTFQQFGVQGQTFLSASGDDGALTTTASILSPSDDPYTTEVGGTTLTTSGPQGKWVSEKVWSWFSLGQQAASSGGISFNYPEPTWQQGVNMSGNGGSAKFRNFPDVALTADNIYIVANNGIPQPGTGGTSCAAPLWAGFMALVNQQASASGQQPLGFINPAIYALAEGKNYSSTFHDITTGNDTNLVSANEFFAEPGYDLCTGWGTPLGSNLINALAPPATTPVLAISTNTISGGNGNGVIDPDECNSLTIILTNQSSIGATGVSATLSSLTPGAIVATGSANYPAIFGNSSAGNLTPFTLSTASGFVCGTPITLALVLKTDQTVQTNTFTLATGVLGSPDVFTSSTILPIPNTNFIPVSSPIVVSGLQSVGHLSVSVYLPAIFDDGLTLQLVGPSGTNVLLSANNGGLGANYGIGCGAGFETTFDDTAVTSIVNGTPPFIGSFQPQQPLSVFNLASGTNLNGIWSLQVLDQFPGDTAELGCWSLNISPNVCSDGGGQCPGADLSLSMSAAPGQVFIGSNLVYTMTVSNAGPGTADNVIVVQSLPPGIGYVGVSNFPVNVSQNGSNLDLVFGSLPVYATATVSVITIPTIPGVLTSTASVGSQESDSNPGNNSASATTLVTEPIADVGVTMRGSPSSVLQAGLLTYTINVTNNGPFPANNVVLANTLPANANFISATTTQGSISNNGTLVLLGTIPNGSNAVVTIAISPTITGNVTATTFASISSSESDPITFNNSASVTTIVGPAADVGVTGFATPSPVIAGTQFTNILSVLNSGPSVASGIALSQSLPSGASFVSSSLAGYVVSNGTITATVASSLTSGQSILITNVFIAPVLLPGVKSQLMLTTIQVSSQSGDPNTNNNVLTLQTVAEPPVVTVVAAGATVTSGTANGAIGPKGNYGVQFYLQNVGTVATTNLVATLVNSNGITFSSGSQTYGVLSPNAPAPTGKPFTFATSSTNGGAILAIMNLQDGTNNLGQVTFTFVMPVVKSFWNTGAIAIPAQQYIPQPAEGPANPYPSTIAVSGVSTNVSSVTVTFSNLFHTYPNDIGALLIGPNGQSCVLMSSAGDFSSMTAPATITFDPNATVLIPDFGTIVSGTYLPEDYYLAEYGTNETFSNSPVPLGPYNTNLSVFAGAPANGNWSLYIEDNGSGDYGAISNGWGLTFTTITPVNQVADLGVSITASASQIGLSNNVTYFWTITNSGPNAVTAYVTNILPAGLSFVSDLLPANASSSINGQTNLCTISNLAANAAVVITNVATGITAGLQTCTVSLGSIDLDPNPVNNSSSVVTTVIPPPVFLSLAPMNLAPNPAVINGNTAITLWVTNTGPSNAYNVIGTFTSSASFILAGSNISQGSFAATNYGSAMTALQINLGTIGVGAGSAVEIVLTNTELSIGTVTNTWTVATTGTNLNYSNKTVTGILSVSYPLAVISNGSPTLVSQAGPPFNGAINSGQTNTVSFAFTNMGAGPTTNLWATLVANSGIRPVTLSNFYGVIPVGGSVSKPFTFVASGNPGSTVTAQFSLKDGSNTNFAAVLFKFMIPTTVTFTNSGAITIPYQGPASPYPSGIQVSGLTNGTSDLLVSKVTATLKGFGHQFSSDVEAILVSPTGQEVPLMEHTGGYHSVTGLQLTFDDTAANYLPLSNALTTGTFLPTEYPPFDSFPGLGPVGTNNPLLGTFGGTDPNGLWSLYVYDDSQGDNGIISGGWTLSLTAVSTINPAARLELSTYESPNPATVGDYVSYQIMVTDDGPGDASGVVLTNILPAGLSLASAPVIVPSGSYTSSGNTVVCSLGAISNGASAYVTIQTTAATAGVITNTAIVTSSSANLYQSGSTNTTATPVIIVAGALSASASGGKLNLSVNGNPTQSYIVETSTNLVNWTAIATNTGVFTYTGTTSNDPVRFYRLIQQPH